MMPDTVVDVTGKVCPLPLIALAKAARTMRKGQSLRITGDDPTFEEAVTDYCREGSHELLETVREGKKVTITLKLNSHSEQV